MKGFLSVIIFIAVVAFGLGLSQSGAALVAVSPKPSQAVVDAMAVAEATAKQEREKEASARTNAVVNSILVGFAIFVLIGGAGGGVIVVSAWNKRHDRKPDEAGRYALVPADANLANPNLTGPYLAERIEAPVMLQLAAQRAKVDIALAMFAGGVNGRMAGSSQRDILPKWDGEIGLPTDAPAPGAEHPEFWLTDDKAKMPALPSSPAQGVVFAQSKEAVLW